MELRTQAGNCRKRVEGHDLDRFGGGSACDEGSALDFEVADKDVALDLAKNLEMDTLMRIS